MSMNFHRLLTASGSIWCTCNPKHNNESAEFYQLIIEAQCFCYRNVIVMSIWKLYNTLLLMPAPITNPEKAFDNGGINKYLLSAELKTHSKD